MTHMTVRPKDFKFSGDEIAARIGEEYRAADSEITSEVEQAAALLLAMNDVLYSRMHEEDGINVSATPDDPYTSYEAMCRDIRLNGRLKVFSGGTHPEYFGSTFTMQQTANVMNRAVHDYYGHYLNGCDFTFWGEFEVWHHLKEFYPEASHSLAFADVVGQYAFATQLQGGFDSPLFEQKALLAPEKWMDWCYVNCPTWLES